MNNKRLALILVLILTICTIAFSASCEEYRDGKFCVPTENEAKAIADIICREMFPEIDFNQYKVEVYNSKDNEKWIVSYEPFDEYILGGGGPEIHIKKKNAEVTFVNIQY